MSLISPFNGVIREIMLEFRKELIKLITAISLFIISAKSHDCYRLESLVNSSDKEILVDVMQSPRKPRKDKTIFIHITNCMNNSEIYINPRQACAVESAALLNPSLDVFVLFAIQCLFPKPIVQKL
uniref:Uncharacterized protein n=1 Tax=Megaselia scalaris TaxID=36166 RepID=T1GTV9_MEGSC